MKIDQPNLFVLARRKCWDKIRELRREIEELETKLIILSETEKDSGRQKDGLCADNLTSN